MVIHDDVDDDDSTEELRRTLGPWSHTIRTNEHRYQFSVHCLAPKWHVTVLTHCFDIDVLFKLNSNFD